MTTQEIASKFGVPMPEICEKLDWQEETVFNWYNYYGRLLVMTSQEVRLLIEKYGYDYVNFVCKAPQLHEIAQLWPYMEGEVKTVEYWATLYLGVSESNISHSN